MRSFPQRPAARDVRNRLAFMAGGTEMEAPRARAKPGRPEGEVSDAVKEWARYRGDITLHRNNVGAVEWRPGRWLRYGLGVGSSDFIGFKSVIVTPDMVGQRVAIFTALECKAPAGGVVSLEQKSFLNAVKDAGGIAAVVRSAEDAEEAVRGR